MGGLEGTGTEKAGKGPGQGPGYRLTALSAPTQSHQPELSGPKDSVPQKLNGQHIVHCIQENQEEQHASSPIWEIFLLGRRGLGP